MSHRFIHRTLLCVSAAFILALVITPSSAQLQIGETNAVEPAADPAAAGLTNPATYTGVDGGPLSAAGAPTPATNAAGQVVVAPQRPIRSFGGFVNLGLPLSRWFNANPRGHNAGATANVLSPLPLSMGKPFAATLYYKVNAFCHSPSSSGYEWQDHRTEFGPVFTFSIHMNRNAISRII